MTEENTVTSFTLSSYEICYRKRQTFIHTPWVLAIHPRMVARRRLHMARHATVHKPWLGSLYRPDEVCETLTYIMHNRLLVHVSFASRCVMKLSIVGVNISGWAGYFSKDWFTSKRRDVTTRTRNANNNVFLHSKPVPDFWVNLRPTSPRLESMWLSVGEHFVIITMRPSQAALRVLPVRLSVILSRA